MHHIEYGYYDIASNELETKQTIEKALIYNPSVISVFPYYLKGIKNHITKNSAKLSTIIDYPFGVSDLKSRQSSVELAIKNGAEIIELVTPAHFLCNRKYDKFREDINTHKSICSENNIELRYVLEYRVFTLELLYKICQILVGHKIDTIYPSSNHLLDNLADNILASVMINQKIDNIKIVVNGNAWTDAHVDTLLSNKKIYAYKTNNIYTLEKINKKLQTNT